ncbi:hypothetical protein PFICI_14150 [Pestalotiopsis fici W106-1]|uniref:Integral membrane protein n=1 Tax=Pestalotiopsis fici (strain W106-1 / CGMCC3.15140) TaxID=1229662 RepID=W3WKM9_PESFW|nr:uncharacterized protein PFICI_14150 [Pestalotiopsis fici W106-1]ETS74284.1 hypothetical protein PFICI_14150 [Pestalotiopsis fici W106-1]
MASRAFFDPMTLLRAAPVISSTAALCYSFDQYNFLTNFLRPIHGDYFNESVPSYFASFFPAGLPQILLFYGISIGTGMANVSSQPNDAWRWYAAGTALAVGHFAFVPKIMWAVSALFEEFEDPKGQGNRKLKRWLDIHAVRSFVVDLPAWVCFSVAALASLQTV